MDTGTHRTSPDRRAGRDSSTGDVEIISASQRSELGGFGPQQPNEGDPIEVQVGRVVRDNDGTKYFVAEPVYDAVAFITDELGVKLHDHQRRLAFEIFAEAIVARTPGSDFIRFSVS